MSDLQRYDDAIETIKAAILRSQYNAAKSVNEKQLMLYFGIGKYISMNSRKGFWGKGAIDTISERLEKELPGLKGFSARNLRYMRMFYEEWSFLDSGKAVERIEDSSDLALASAKLKNAETSAIWHSQMPKSKSFPNAEFLAIGFTHHRIIFEKVKDPEERYFYIRKCAEQKYTAEELKKKIEADDFHHQGTFPNNFIQTLPAADQAFRAISTFKDEYLLDFINVEELSIRDRQDLDERVVENAIIHNVKNF